jgi:hypothetical protein
MRVQIYVPRSEDKGASELKRVLPQLVLPTTRRYGTCPSLAIVFPEELEHRADTKIDGAVGTAIGVDQQRKCNPRLLAKDARVFHIAEPHSGNTGAFELESLFPFAQLRDMLAAEHSTVMAQKRHHTRRAGPQRTQPNLLPVGIGKYDLGELGAKCKFHRNGQQLYGMPTPLGGL